MIRMGIGKLSTRTNPFQQQLKKTEQINTPAQMYSKEIMMELKDANQTGKLRPIAPSNEFPNSEDNWDPEM